MVRRRVLAETLADLGSEARRQQLGRAAASNLARWAAQAPGEPDDLIVRVESGDWGEVTSAATREFGRTFAMLNMANAFVPGGAYVEGTAAQEENMFRRTDCHFAITDAEYDAATDRYHPELTALIEGRAGRVYLDTTTPRICIRGREDRSRPDLGYALLPDDEVFAFYELRAAAVDLRGARRYDAEEMRRRIEAQFATLTEAGVRHVVLGAFGCGAFGNPADQVAELYRDAIAAHCDDFSVIIFPIYDAGYGPDNYRPFVHALSGLLADSVAE